MGELMLNLIVIAGTLVVIAVIFTLVKRKGKQEKESIDELVKQKGWHIDHIREPLVKGFRITAPYWTLEAMSRSSGREVSPASTDMEQKTTWTARQSGSTLLVGPNQGGNNLVGKFEMLMKQVLFSALGDEARGINPVQVGSSAFQKKFMVWAADADDADRLLSPGVQSALLAWEKTTPLLKRTSQETTIELKGVHLSKPEELAALVQLGEMLL